MSSLAVFWLVNGLYTSDLLKYVSKRPKNVCRFWFLDYSHFSTKQAFVLKNSWSKVCSYIIICYKTY